MKKSGLNKISNFMFSHIKEFIPITFFSSLFAFSMVSGQICREPSVLNSCKPKQTYLDSLISNNEGVLFTNKKESEIHNSILSFIDEPLIGYCITSDTCYSSKNLDTIMNVESKCGFVDLEKRGIILFIYLKGIEGKFSNYTDLNISDIGLYVAYPEESPPNNMEVFGGIQLGLAENIRTKEIWKPNLGNIERRGSIDIFEEVEGYSFSYSSDIIGVAKSLTKKITSWLNYIVDAPTLERLEREHSMKYKKPIRIERIVIPLLLSATEMNDLKAIKIEIRWKSNIKKNRPYLIYFDGNVNKNLFMRIPPPPPLPPIDKLEVKLNIYNERVSTFNGTLYVPQIIEEP